MRAGAPVEIGVSEPWDVVSIVGEGCKAGYIISATATALIIGLKDQLSLPGGRYGWFLACPRHVGDSFSDDHGKLFCNLNSMTEQQVKNGVPSDLSSFIGELTMMGDVVW